ncbi:hypothetical protein FRC09_010223 [Ceratobasidium sp. 395]|nr:hypothetical protein FRC09_010223 [Ceratobasidium sp. 395]
MASLQITFDAKTPEGKKSTRARIRSSRAQFFLCPGPQQKVVIQQADPASSNTTDQSQVSKGQPNTQDKAPTTDKLGLVSLTPSGGDTQYTIRLGDGYLSPSKSVSDADESHYHVQLGDEEFPWAVESVGGSRYRIGIPNMNVYWFALIEDKSPAVSKDETPVVSGDKPPVVSEDKPPTVQLARAIGDPGEFWIIEKEN